MVLLDLVVFREECFSKCVALLTSIGLVESKIDMRWWNIIINSYILYNTANYKMYFIQYTNTGRFSPL